MSGSIFHMLFEVSLNNLRQAEEIKCSGFVCGVLYLPQITFHSSASRRYFPSSLPFFVLFLTPCPTSKCLFSHKPHRASSVKQP